MERCHTKYPILLLHGMGFHDRLPIHYYWGRIPHVLRQNGAEIYFGDQDGNASVQYNAERLIPRIHAILKDSGAEKLNLIAHSKGGLEARCLASSMGLGNVIASVTTLSTPHNGSKTVDWLLPRFPHLIRFGSSVTDIWRRILGDRHPRTFTVITQLTTDYMREFNAQNPDDPQVFYQSYAFIMQHWYSDPVMAFPNIIVKAFEGDNDGLLTPDNARWTNFQGVFTGTSRRGISHPDVTDYTRLPFTRKLPASGQISDMTELYLRIVEGLKERGL